MASSRGRNVATQGSGADVMRPRILLSSVFKPFAIDDLYSRKDSIIELFHNQLTKYQGIYSIRNFYDSYGIHAIANNIETPCTVLDFPTMKRFIREVEKGYDYVGISSIVQNFQKVKWMVEQTRKLSPGSKIILGGFCAGIPDLKKVLDVDYVCVGEGIGFMRKLLGLPAEFDFKNPDVFTLTRRVMGVSLFGIPKTSQIVVGLGCSYGCDFCSPSHFFGRRHIRFYQSGESLFKEIARVTDQFGSNMISLIGDDNFLLDLKRADQLRRCVVESGRIFNMMIFASADKVAEFGAEKLAEMGVGLIWIGREGKFSDYRKNAGLDMKTLVADLRRHGIKTILSSILFLDGHTRENIREDIDDHLACRPAFSQFSYYAPLPQTPLWERMIAENRLLDGIPWEDMHAFDELWFSHPRFSISEAKTIQDGAYLRDFHELGPSLLRMIEADYEGWLYLRQSGKPHLRARADFFAGQMWKYKIMLAAIQHLMPTDPMRGLAQDIRARVETSFGKGNMMHGAAAAGLFLAGKFGEFRNRHGGDVMQPYTRLTRYNN